MPEFFAQFGLIARANRWMSETKTAVMIGGRHAQLESVQNLDDLSFEDLKTKLELRLGKLSLGKVIICSLLIGSRNLKKKYSVLWFRYREIAVISLSGMFGLNL